MDKGLTREKKVSEGREGGHENENEKVEKREVVRHARENIVIPHLSLAKDKRGIRLDMKGGFFDYFDFVFNSSFNLATRAPMKISLLASRSLASIVQ